MFGNRKWMGRDSSWIVLNSEKKNSCNHSTKFNRPCVEIAKQRKRIIPAAVLIHLS